MAEKEFDLEILATDHPFYRGRCSHLVYPALDGLAGIKYGHDYMVTCVAEGELRYFADGKWHYAAVSSGYLEVQDNRVMVLVDSAELPEEIDVKRAEAAKERAEEKMKQEKSLKEFYHTQAALNRAMNRLKISSKHFKE